MKPRQIKAPPGLWTAIDAIAERYGTNGSELVRQALVEIAIRHGHDPITGQQSEPQDSVSNARSRIVDRSTSIGSSSSSDAST